MTSLEGLCGGERLRRGTIWWWGRVWSLDDLVFCSRDVRCVALGSAGRLRQLQTLPQVGVQRCIIGSVSLACDGHRGVRDAVWVEQASVSWCFVAVADRELN